MWRPYCINRGGLSEALVLGGAEGGGYGPEVEDVSAQEGLVLLIGEEA